MNVESFYRGVLYELHKTAAPIEQKKKPSMWNRMALTGLGVGGAGLLGYLGYNAYKNGKPTSPTTSTQTPNTPATPEAPAPASAPSALPQLSSLDKFDRVADTAVRTDMKLGLAGLGAAGANALSGGKLMNTGVGRTVLKPLTTYPALQIPGAASTVQKMAPTLSKLPGVTKGFLAPGTLGAGMLALPNVQDALHDYESTAGKTVAATGIGAGAFFIPGGGQAHLAALLNKIPLNMAGSIQQQQADRTALLDDVLLELYKGMKNPQTSEQYKVLANNVFTDPELKKKLIDPTVNPGFWNRAAQRNFGLTDSGPMFNWKDPKTWFNTGPNGFWGGEQEQNVDPTRAMMKKVQDMMASNTVQ